MVDYYVVAIPAVGGGGNDNAACRRDYGRAVVAEAVNVDTGMVSGLTGEGVGTVAIARGDSRAARHRPHEAAVSAACAAGVGAVLCLVYFILTVWWLLTVGLSLLICAVHLFNAGSGVLGIGLCLRCFRGLLRVILGDHVGDRRRSGLLGSFGSFVLGDCFFYLGFKALQGLVRFGDLIAYLLLLRLQISLSGFVFGLLLLVLSLDLFGLFACSDILCLKRFIARHYLAHIVKRGEKIGEVVRLKDHREDIVSAVLLHRAHTAAIFLKLALFLVLCRVDLFCLLCDQLSALVDLLGNDLELFIRKLLLFVERSFLFQDVCLLILECLEPLHAVLDLIGQLLLLRLELAQSLRLVRKCGDRDHADHKGCKHQHCHNHGND